MIQQAEECGRFTQRETQDVSAHERLKLLFFDRLFYQFVLNRQGGDDGGNANAQQSKCQRLIGSSRTWHNQRDDQENDYAHRHRYPENQKHLIAHADSCLRFLWVRKLHVFYVAASSSSSNC